MLFYSSELKSLREEIKDLRERFDQSSSRQNKEIVHVKSVHSFCF